MVWSDMCSRKARGGYGCLQGDVLAVGLSTQGEKAGLGGAGAEEGWSRMELDGAPFRNTSFLLWCFISLVCWSGSLPLILL